MAVVAGVAPHTDLAPAVHGWHGTLISGIAPGTTAHTAIEATGLAGLAGAVAGMLPTIAVVLAIVWYCLEIWESRTLARLRHRAEVDAAIVRAETHVEAAKAAETVKVATAEAVAKVEVAAVVAAETLQEKS